MKTTSLTSSYPAGLCVACGASPTVLTSALGLVWCASCKPRGELLNWGATHAWRPLAIHPYAIAEGLSYWYIATTLGADDFIWLMSGLTELLNNEDEVA